MPGEEQHPGGKHTLEQAQKGDNKPKHNLSLTLEQEFKKSSLKLM